MANGRMITNLICRDKRVNQLVNDTSRLAFTWLITFADREGRTPGDPAVVRSMVFPRRQDVTIEQMEAFIREWHDLGLVVWYEADDDKWIWFPSFDKNQQGLRKDREAPSKIPQPPELTPDLIRSDDGVTPDQIPVKLNEVKGIEVKGTPPPPNIFAMYETEIGMITPMVSNQLSEAEGQYPLEWFEPAFKEAARHNARSWAYCEAILKGWKANGFKAGKTNGASSRMLPDGV